MVTARKGFDLSALAAQAERAKAEGDPTGFVSGGFFNSDFSIILGGGLEFDPQLPEVERQRIINQVVLPPGLARPISADGLLRGLSRLEREYLARPLVGYRLLTGISVRSTIDVPTTRVGGAVLVFNPKLQKAFEARSKLAEESRHILGAELPANYMRVSAHVRARSPFAAAEFALDALDLLRGSWNLVINRGKSWRHSSGRPKPINDIRLAPFHTVHVSSGALATETVWYDPGYRPTADLFSDKSKFATLGSLAAHLRRELASLPYHEDIQQALIRYVRALDAADLNDTFLRLWSLVEYLTDSTQDPYKVAIRRAAFLFADRQRSELVLSNLATHRNRFVHAGSETGHIESLVFQLKRHVDALLLFHITNSFGFNSRSEAARFMDLPTETKDINDRIRRLQQAKRFIAGA